MMFSCCRIKMKWKERRICLIIDVVKSGDESRATAENDSLIDETQDLYTHTAGIGFLHER